MISLYISIKPEDFVGIENGVGEGSAHVGPARAYVTSPLEEAADDTLLRRSGYRVNLVIRDCTTFATWCRAEEAALGDITLLNRWLELRCPDRRLMRLFRSSTPT
jgi:hypothetical protein